jgi:hypothetical protein
MVSFNNPNMKEDTLATPFNKKEWDVFLKMDKDAQNAYDLSDEGANTAAKKKGLVIIYPKDNQIQIDIDSEEAFKEFQLRFEKLFDTPLCMHQGENVISPGLFNIKTFPSSSGLPNRHIYITFQNRTFSALERIHLQSVLGSDPMRELLDTKRLFDGYTKTPTRLFEKPKVAEQLK